MFPSPSGNILQNSIVEYHNQDIDTDVIHRSYSHFPSFSHFAVCVFSSTGLSRVWGGINIQHHGQDTEQFCHDKEPLVLSFITTLTSLLLFPHFPQ